MLKKLTATVILVGALTLGNGVFAEENTDSPELEDGVDVIVDAEVEVDADTEVETTEEDATVEEGTDTTDADTTEEDATVEEGTDTTDADTTEEDATEEEGTDTTDADDTESDIVTPESGLYEAIRLMEKAVYTLTEETVAKALLLEEYANKRLAETEVLLENGNVEAAEQLLAELFEEVGLNLEEAAKVVADAKVAEEADPTDPVDPADPVKEEDEADADVTDLDEEINENIAKRSLNLLALLERDNLPEQAKAGIRKALANQARAMERSNKNKEVVVEEEEATEEEEEVVVEEEATVEATVEASAKVSAEVPVTEADVTTVEENDAKRVEKANAKVEKATEKATQRVEKAVEKGQKGIEKALEKAEKAGNGRP